MECVQWKQVTLVVMIRGGLPVYTIKVSTNTNMVYADQVSNIADVF